MNTDLALLPPEVPKKGMYYLSRKGDEVYKITSIKQEMRYSHWEGNVRIDKPETVVSYDELDICTQKKLWSGQRTLAEIEKEEWTLETNPFETLEQVKPFFDKFGDCTERIDEDVKPEPPEPSHPSELWENATFDKTNSLASKTKRMPVALAESVKDSNLYALALSNSDGRLKQELRDMETNAQMLKRLDKYSKFMIAQAKREMEFKLQKVRIELAKVQDYCHKLNGVLYTMNLFMGCMEDLHILADGEAAPDTEKVYVYQGVAYCDEEFAWYDQDFDYEKMDNFVEFCKKHSDFWKQIMPHPKSILGLRIRRTDKRYTSDRLENFLLNLNNHKNFFLVRNGDRLFKLDVPICLTDRLTAAKDEMQLAYDEALKSDYYREIFEKKKKYYTNVSALVRGLLYRSEAFSPHRCIMPEAPRIVLNDPNLVPVYDLTDALFEGGIDFWQWHDELNKDLKRGSKILVGSDVYTVEEAIEYDESGKVVSQPGAWGEGQNEWSGRWQKGYEHGDFKYLAEDEGNNVFDRELIEYRPSKKRKAHVCNRSEACVYDWSKINEESISQLEKYARSRLYRSTRADIVKAMYACVNAWKEHSMQKEGFKTLVKSTLLNAGYAVNEKAISWDALIEQEMRNFDKLLVYKRTMLDSQDTTFRVVCRKAVAKRNQELGYFSKTGKLPF